MNKKNMISVIITGGAAVLFAVFTVLVAVADVRPLGPLGSEIGFARLNTYIFDKIGTNDAWGKVTEVFGIAAIAVACFFCGLGIYTAIKRKSLRRVDKWLYIMFGSYALIVIFYLLFELIVVNYRPILSEGELQASYPSSHTLIVLTVLGTAIPQVLRLKNRAARIMLVSVAAAVMALTVVGRLVCGVHWFTDILGGVLLSAVIVLLNVSLNMFFDGKSGAADESANESANESGVL